jgi:hypothetical protein
MAQLQQIIIRLHHDTFVAALEKMNGPVVSAVVEAV